MLPAMMNAAAMSIPVSKRKTTRDQPDAQPSPAALPSLMPPLRAEVIACDSGDDESEQVVHQNRSVGQLLHMRDGIHVENELEHAQR